jgi:hypothetical protein
MRVDFQAPAGWTNHANPCELLLGLRAPAGQGKQLLNRLMLVGKIAGEFNEFPVDQE